MKVIWNKLYKGKFWILAFLLSIIPGFAQSPEATAKASQNMSNSDFVLLMIMIMVVVIAVLVLLVTVYALTVVHTVLLKEKGKEPVSLWGSVWKNFNRSMTDAVPVEEEKSILLDHDYDGIRELDNHLPPWWLYLFYGTTVFAIIYMLNYHVFEWSDLPAKEYEVEMAMAAKEVEAYNKLHAANIDETNVELSEKGADLSKGAEIWKANCATCHGQNGEGGAGPNMTDEYWLYGGDVKDIFKTVKFGSPNNPAMVAWEGTLKPQQMQQVASFILKKLQGTNPEGAKGPEGEKYEGKEAK